MTSKTVNDRIFISSANQRFSRIEKKTRLRTLHLTSHTPWPQVVEAKGRMESIEEDIQGPHTPELTGEEDTF